MTIKALVFATVSLSLTMLSHGRIGETLKKCEARYGKVHKKDLNRGGYQFVKSEFTLTLNFFKGECDALSVSKVKSWRDLSDNEIKLLMKANSLGHEWVKIRGLNPNIKYWSTNKNKLRAQYDTSTHTLIIITLDKLARSSDAEAKKEKEGLDGF